MHLVCCSNPNSDPFLQKSYRNIYQTFNAAKTWKGRKTAVQLLYAEIQFFSI